MRERSRILDNLEGLYREAFLRAEGEGDGGGMEDLDFQFQRDQLYFELLLDLRDLFVAMSSGKDPEEKTTSLLEKAQALRGLAKLR